MSFFISCLFMGVALSMDAFSLALAYGTVGMSNKKCLILSIIVGAFHFFMPQIALVASKLIGGNLLIGANLLVSLILMIIALSMLASTKKEEVIAPLTSFYSLLLFAFSVSLDAFSLGIGLSFLYDSLLVPSIIFAITSFSFTYAGLFLGNKLSIKFGKLATFLGSILLFVLALHYFFS